MLFPQGNTEQENHQTEILQPNRVGIVGLEPEPGGTQNKNLNEKSILYTSLFSIYEDINFSVSFRKLNYPIPFATNDGIQDLHHTFAGTISEIYEFWVTVIGPQK